MGKPSHLNQTLAEPEKPFSVHQDAQWLAGEGAGSWFHLSAESRGYRINRYSPSGIIECTGHFDFRKVDDFSLAIPYQFTHLSHCNQVQIKQNDRILTAVRTGD